VTCKWVKQQGPTKGFDFDVSKAEQIFDLLLKEKQLKLTEDHKIPTAQEINGRAYCKWHHSFTHTTNDCQALRRQIQTAIEQGRLILGQFAMKVDTNPFPGVNMVEHSHSARRQLDFSFDINMAGPVYNQGENKEQAGPRDRPRHDDRRYITEEQVRSVRYQKPHSTHLLNKYERQHDRRRQYERDDERYEHRARRKPKEKDAVDKHWDCPFFKHCWDAGMSRLPTADNCPECGQQKGDTAPASVFKRLGPLPPQDRQGESSRAKDVEESEAEEDRYHRPRWCPDGLGHTQKRRVQRLRSLEEAEARYLHTLRKARPDLAMKLQRTLKTPAHPQKKEWRPKPVKADGKSSAGTNMVFILPSEFCAPRTTELPVAQLDCGPRPVIFEKPQEKGYKHLKALYLRGYINGQPVGKMLVDTGAAVNIMPYSML
jgi:hypothetical protein